MNVERKAYTPFEVKAIDERARTFTGRASTWDVDLDGDRIDKGAFKKTLADWRGSKGRKIIPLIDQHNYMSVRSVFGKMVEAEETDAGLETTFEIVNTPDGDEYLSRIKDGFLNGLSIGFRTIQSEPEKDKNKREVRVIKEVQLMEISAVIWGANPEALIDTAALKALRRFHPDKVDASLIAARKEIDDLIAMAGPEDEPDDDQEPDSGGREEEEPKVSPEVTAIEKELADAIALKETAVANEDFDRAALWRDRIAGIEARLERAKARNRREQRKKSYPDDPGRMASDARLARIGAQIAAY